MESATERINRFTKRKVIGLIGAPLVAAIMLLFVNLDPANPNVTRCAAVALLMALWWITEAIPISATALVPVALFPLLGIMKAGDTAGIYFNDVIFLFVGGFIIALAMERWELHRRIALKIILIIGTGAGRLYLGFMVATFFLSMWISNTATTMMMVPMAMAIIIKMKEHFGAEKMGRFAVGLLIAIAYSASIGGTATLIGTPPNLAFSRIFTIDFPHAPEISFAQWMIFGLPFAIVFLVVTWMILTRIFVPAHSRISADMAVFKDEYRKLGKMKYEEKWVLGLFLAAALLWIFRNNIQLGILTVPGWSNLLIEPSYIRDGTVAIFIALILFIVPSGKDSHGHRTRLMTWRQAVKLHWGIVLLFGGGFALAAGFENSGLAAYLGHQIEGMKALPPLLIVIIICTLLTFLTELTSNTATTQIFLPILGSLAVAIQVNPLLLMIPATLSASCAFMLPVATPPNAIVFGTGEVKIEHMMRTGIVMNLIGIVLITAAIYLIAIHVFGIDLSVMPDWAVMP